MIVKKKKKKSYPLGVLLPHRSFCGGTPWSNPNHLLKIVPEKREFINANVHVGNVVNQSMSWMTAAL